MQGFPGQQLSTNAFSVTNNQLYRHQQNLSQVCHMTVNLQSILTSHYILINLMLPKHSSLRKQTKKTIIKQCRRWDVNDMQFIYFHMETAAQKLTINKPKYEHNEQQCLVMLQRQNFIFNTINYNVNQA